MQPQSHDELSGRQADPPLPRPDVEARLADAERDLTTAVEACDPDLAAKVEMHLRYRSAGTMPCLAIPVEVAQLAERVWKRRAERDGRIVASERWDHRPRTPRVTRPMLPPRRLIQRRRAGCERRPRAHAPPSGGDADPGGDPEGEPHRRTPRRDVAGPLSGGQR
jgi:hypothetical protein